MKPELELDAGSFEKAFDDFRTADKIATKRSLNIAVAKTRSAAIRDVKSEFINRNTYTKRNIVFDQVSTNDRSKMKASIGATTNIPYMELHHKGGVVKNKGSKEFDGDAIPDNPSRQGKNFRKPVRKPNYKSKFGKNLLNTTGGLHRGSPKSRRVASMFMAKKKKKFVLMKNAIYKINSIESRGGKIKVNSERMYAIKRTPTVVQPVDWLFRHAEYRGARVGENYKQQLQKLWETGTVI